MSRSLLVLSVLLAIGCGGAAADPDSGQVAPDAAAERTAPLAPLQGLGAWCASRTAADAAAQPPDPALA